MTDSSVTMALGLPLFGATLAVLLGHEIRRLRGDVGAAAAEGRWVVGPLLLGCAIVVIARFALLAYGG